MEHRNPAKLKETHKNMNEYSRKKPPMHLIKTCDITKLEIKHGTHGGPPSSRKEKRWFSSTGDMHANKKLYTLNFLSNGAHTRKKK